MNNKLVEFEELEQVEELGSGKDFVDGVVAGAAVAGGCVAAYAAVVGLAAIPT